jgi:hypothetical protein
MHLCTSSAMSRRFAFAPRCPGEVASRGNPAAFRDGEDCRGRRVRLRYSSCVPPNHAIAAGRFGSVCWGRRAGLLASQFFQQWPFAGLASSWHHPWTAQRPPPVWRSQSRSSSRLGVLGYSPHLQLHRSQLFSHVADSRPSPGGAAKHICAPGCRRVAGGSDRAYTST